MISGFLITTLLIREQLITDTVNLRSFYIRRALRIMPAYFTLLAVLALFQWQGILDFSARAWMGAGTWTINFIDHPYWDFGHLWSLAVEEHFYLLWPFVFLYLPSKIAIRVIWLSLASVFVGRWIILFEFDQWTESARFWTFTRFDAIAAGCLIAYLGDERKWEKRLDDIGSHPLFWPGTLASLFATPTLMLISTKTRIGLAYSIDAVLLGFLVWASVRFPGNWFGKLLNHPRLKQVGILSYSLYLWHRLFIRPADLPLGSPFWDLWTFFPANLLAVSLAAVACHSLVERPLLNLRNRWFAR